MRHKTAERWLAADLGGSLPEGRRRRLEAHLAACPRCRSTRKEWAIVESRAKIEIPPEGDAFWRERWNSLRIALDAPAPEPERGRKPTSRVPGFFPWRTWAWGAGGAGVAAAAALLFVLLSPSRPLEEAYAYSLGDHGAFLEEGIAADEAVLADFNESLRDSLAESMETVPDDVTFLTADHTLALEGLSDEEIGAVVSEIGLETGAGER